MTEERQNAGEGGKSGQLKIFFGYAAGVGKTYAMLQAALTAEERGIHCYDAKRRQLFPIHFKSSPDLCF